MFIFNESLPPSRGLIFIDYFTKTCIRKAQSWRRQTHPSRATMAQRAKKRKRENRWMAKRHSTQRQTKKVVFAWSGKVASIQKEILVRTGPEKWPRRKTKNWIGWPQNHISFRFQRRKTKQCCSLKRILRILNLLTVHSFERFQFKLYLDSTKMDLTVGLKRQLPLLSP